MHEEADVYDPVLLRTFLALADTGGFTAAGRQLGLSQPTVSQHVRRLEDQVGRALVLRDTRDVRLTDAGEALAGFARTILAAHATAERYFDASASKGRLRFGTADALAITQLPRILRSFRQSNPQVSLELSVGQSVPLTRRLNAGQLDLVFVNQLPGESVEGELVRRDRYVWIGHDSAEVPAGGPVPLVAYRAPSTSRRTAIAALEEAGRRWRVACTVRDVGGLIAAVRAGLGVAPFPHSLIPGDLERVPARIGLPELGEVDFRLLAHPSAPPEPVAALTEAIVSRTLGPVGDGRRSA